MKYQFVKYNFILLQNEVLFGTKTRDELDSFIMNRLKTDIVHVDSKNSWDIQKETHSNWLLILTPLSSATKKHKIIATMLVIVFYVYLKTYLLTKTKP